MRQHDTDWFSLAAGLVFTILGVVLAVSAATASTIDGRWIAPVILIGLGAGGVAASLAATRRQRQAAAAVPPADSGDWPRDPFA
jgi:uncharacterized integral membrane protein